MLVLLEYTSDFLVLVPSGANGIIAIVFQEGEGAGRGVRGV